jgi:hypothetical protein
MAYENQEDGEVLEKSFLEGMMDKMDEEDRGIIERELFNSADSIPLSTIFDAIADKEEARALMGAFEDYIAERGSLSKEEREGRVQEINDFIMRRVEL